MNPSVILSILNANSWEGGSGSVNQVTQVSLQPNSHVMCGSALEQSTEHPSCPITPITEVSSAGGRSGKSFDRVASGKTSG